MADPRVLIVTTEAPDILSGGLGFFNDCLWRELRRRGFAFRTLYLNNQKTQPSRLADYQVLVEEALPFDSTPESSAMNKAWTTRQRLQPILDDYAPEVISVHENWSVLPFYFELNKVQFTLHASYIGMEHYLVRTQPGLHYYWEQRIALRQTGAVVMHSDWTRRLAREHIANDGVVPHVFPIGLNFSDYPAQKKKHPEGKIVVSFFGRSGDAVKNFKAFRKAVLMLPAEHRARIEPRVYSPDALPEALSAEGFRGLTFVRGEAKEQAFAETDIVVMPSTHESFGIVGLEALLCNCALIATPGLGMDSYMPPECACEPNADAIKDRLMSHIANFSEITRKQLAGEYRSAVTRPELDVKNMADNYIQVWQELRDKNTMKDAAKT